MGDAGHIICDAILIRHLLAYESISTGQTRIVEPHAYGVADDGQHALLSWRTRANELGKWELVRVDKMRAVRILSVHSMRRGRVIAVTRRG